MTSIATPAAPTANRKVILGALILGAIAAGLIVAFLATQSETSKPSPSGTDLMAVVVATREIPVGTELDETMVRLKEIPRSAVISDPFTDTKEVIGEVTRFPLQANEQLAVGRLVQTNSNDALSFTIPEGLRGFTIKVDQEKSPAGLLAPGDFVDVLLAADVRYVVSPTGLTAIPGDNNELDTVITLLQNVQVLSVERDYVKNAGVYDETTRGAPTGTENVNYITMAVTPEQAQLLWLAAQKGNLTLTLRPFGDNNVPQLAPVSEPLRIN